MEKEEEDEEEEKEDGEEEKKEEEEQLEVPGGSVDPRVDWTSSSLLLLPASPLHPSIPVSSPGFGNILHVLN